MKCLSCDCVLSDFEATRKSATTGEFLDMCNNCFETIKYDVQVLERQDLKQYVDIVEEE